MWPLELSITTPNLPDWVARWTVSEAVAWVVALLATGGLIGAAVEIRRLHAQLMQAWQALGQEQKIRRELLDERDLQRKRYDRLKTTLDEVRELAAAYSMLGPLGPLLDSLREERPVDTQEGSA